MPEERASMPPKDEGENELVAEVRSPEDVPNFQSEAELDAFWSSHEISREYLDRLGIKPTDRGPSSRLRRILDVLVDR